MEPRDVVRISILVSFGALALAVAAWLLAFALTGADAVWARLQRLRERQR